SRGGRRIAASSIFGGALLASTVPWYQSGFQTLPASCRDDIVFAFASRQPTLPTRSQRQAHAVGDIALARILRVFPKLLAANQALVVAVLVMNLAFYQYGERIQVNGGLGWDGRSYCGLAKDFYRQVVEQGLSDYHIHRILPSAVVHYSFRW